MKQSETFGKRMKRRILDIGSAVYRNVFFPFKAFGIERKCDSIIRPKAYLYQGSALQGKNYIGRRSELRHTKLGFGSYVNDRCRFTDTVIGKFCSIGTDVEVVIGRHPVSENISTHPAFYAPANELGFSFTDSASFTENKWVDKDNGICACIGNDVWIGNRVLIMEGLTVGDGAIIASGSVLTKDAKPYGVYAGVPARMIKSRFDDDKIKELLDLKWWDKDTEWLVEHGNEFKNPGSATEGWN